MPYQAVKNTKFLKNGGTIHCAEDEKNTKLTIKDIDFTDGDAVIEKSTNKRWDLYSCTQIVEAK